jgi:DNA-directed RNA polymerase subunit K/omega
VHNKPAVLALREIAAGQVKKGEPIEQLDGNNA